MVSFIALCRKTWVTSLLVTAPSVHAVRTDGDGSGGLSTLVSSTARQARQYAAGAIHASQKVIEEVQKMFSNLSPAHPIPLKVLGQENWYTAHTGTLGDEMKRYGEGTLVLLQRVQDDKLLQAARGTWALDFSNGEHECAALLQGAGLAEDACAQPYSGSLVVVVGREDTEFEDDAHYFPIKFAPSFWTSHLVVHGRRQPGSAPMRAISSSGGSPKPVGPDRSLSPQTRFDPSWYLPEVYFSQGRVEVVQHVGVRKSYADVEDDEVVRSIGGLFTETLKRLVEQKMLASDWTPCLTTTRVSLLPSAHFFPMRELDQEEVADSLQAMVASLRTLCDRFDNLKARLDDFENKKLEVTRQDAAVLLQFLFDRMKRNNRVMD